MNYPYFNPYQRNDFQPIQNINIQPQASCYFVKAPSDLNSINVMPNTFYLGINAEANEIYVRKMNNDGLVDVKTYSLQSEKKEKTDIKTLLDRLDNIDKRIAELKGKEDEHINQSDSK